ncbi:MAG: SulP family inorganic anion transporter [Actinomycetes bacterium]
MAEASDAPRWERLVPGVGVLRHYDRSWLRGDLVAGATVTAYLIPQVMAYAQIAGLPPIVGLWGMIAPLLLYSLLGTSRVLSAGPESTTAIMTAAALGAVTVSLGPDRWADVAGLLALLVGGVSLIAWLARLGFLADLLSKPVLQGYLVGVAVFMITGQLGTVTRLEVEGDGPLGEVASLADQLGAIHWATLGLAAATLAVVAGLQFFAPRWPGALIAMLLAGAFAAWPLGRSLGLEVIGEVPLGLPAPRLPDASGIDPVILLPWAAGIALVGYSDNVLTGRAFAAKHHHRIDAGQELLALGAVNVAAGLTNALPVSSSGSRTVLAHAVGAKSQLYSLVSLVGVVAVLLVAGPVLATFPLGAMGAIVIFAALRLVDVGELRRIARFRKSELVLAVVTAAGVIVLGVLGGIGVAVAVSLLDLIRRIVRPNAGVLGYVPGIAGMHDVTDWEGATQVEGLVVFRYDAPLFFANSDNFLTRATEAVEGAPWPVEWVLVNAEANVELDLTAVDALEEFRSSMAGEGIVVAFARLKSETRELFDDAGLTASVGSNRMYATLPTAVEAYATAFANKHGRRPRGLPPAAG